MLLKEEATLNNYPNINKYQIWISDFGLSKKLYMDKFSPFTMNIITQSNMNNQNKMPFGTPGYISLELQQHTKQKINNYGNHKQNHNYLNDEINIIYEL